MATQLVENEQIYFQEEPSGQDMDALNFRVDLPLELLDAQGRLLDSVIRYTFDTLNAQHLDLRIVAGTQSH